MLRTIAATALIGLAGAAAPAAAVPPVELVGHTANYLNAQGFHVAKQGVASKDLQPGRWAAAPKGGPIEFDTTNAWPLLLDLADRYGSRGRMTAPQYDMLETVVHELLHQRGHAGWYSLRAYDTAAGHEMRWWEEGITEAVSQDITPHVSRALFGHLAKPSNDPSYQPRTKAVRQLSVFATWPGKWRDSEATGWRSRLLMADYPTRARMIETAHSIRADWRAR